MPKLPGDISHIFDTPVPNLDWLDVDEKAYRDLETLPRQNIDVVPDLVEAWSHHDKGGVQLIPNVDPKSGGPLKWLDAKTAREVDGMKAAVDKAVREHMMEGWDAKTIASWVRQRVPPQHLASVLPTIKAAAEDMGLLGNVYVDARIWDKCAQGEGQKVAQKASQAQFVLGADKCSGCVHNQEGRCGVFKKKLVFDVVPYSDKLVNEYTQKLRVPTAAVTASADTPKEQLRTLFRMVATPTPVMVEYGSDVADPITEGDQVARDRVASGFYEPPSTSFMGTKDRSLYRDLAQKMMKAGGKLSDVLRSRFASSTSDAIAVLEREKNLLGSVYVRPDQFDNCRKANSFFRRHHVAAPKILKMDKCSGCQFYRHGACSLMGKEVVSSIEYTPQIFANEIEALTSNGHLTREAAAKYMVRSATEDLKSLLAEALNNPSTREAPTYENHYEFAHMGHVDDVEVATTVSTAIPPQHASVVRAAYKAAYKGTTGKRLQAHLVDTFGRDAVVAAADHLRPVVRLAGLLGNVVLDMRGFKTADEAKSFLHKHRMKPAYLLKEGCGCGGSSSSQPDYSKVFPGLTLINYGHIGEVELEKVAQRLDNMVVNKRISSTVGANLKAKIGSVNGWDIMRDAYLSPKPAPVAGPERKARAAAPLVSRTKIRTELGAVTTAKVDRERTALISLIDAQLEAGTITASDADALRGKVGTDSRVQILQSIVAAQDAYTKARIAEADRQYREHVATADNGLGIRIEQNQVVHVTAPKVSSNERTRFRRELVSKMNEGCRGDALKGWLRASFDQRIIRDQADFIRKALTDASVLALDTHTTTTNDPTIEFGLNNALTPVSIDPVAKTVELDIGFDTVLGDINT